MGKLIACRSGVEQEYDKLNRGKPAVIPPYGLDVWRRKWIILLRGDVLSCNVTGIFYAYHGSVGPASGFWRRLIVHTSCTGSAKKILQQWLSETVNRFSHMGISILQHWHLYRHWPCGPVWWDVSTGQVKQFGLSSCLSDTFGAWVLVPFSSEDSMAFLELCEKIWWWEQSFFPFVNNFWFPVPQISYDYKL